MSKLTGNLTGQRTGRVTVLDQRKAVMPVTLEEAIVCRCRCDCGTEFTTRRQNLVRGMKSCGCLKREGRS